MFLEAPSLHRRTIRWIWVPAALAFWAACDGSDPAGPGPNNPDAGTNSPTMFTHGAYLAENVGMSDVDSLLQVELVISNLPEFSGNPGESVVLRGTDIYIDGSSLPFDWSSDQVRGVIQADRSATIVFYQDLSIGGQSRTNFKVYRDGTQTPVLVDQTTTTAGSEGNVQLELLTIAERGDKVRVTVDALDPQARASVPTLTTGVALVEPVLGERSDFPDLLDVELRVTNLPESLGPRQLGVGQILVVRGINIYANGLGGPKSWDGDDVSGQIQADRSVVIRFYQSLSLNGQQRLADFKVFRIGTWDEVVVDNDAPDGNIRLDLLAVASLGQKVRVTIDASNPTARPPVPEYRDGPFAVLIQEGGSRLSSKIEVELVVTNLPAFAGAVGDRVSVRGQDLYVNDTTRISWKGDDIFGVINASRTATATFFVANTSLSFKLFKARTMVEALVDNENSTDHRVEIDLSSVARVGSKVRVQAHAGDARALPVAPVLRQRAFTAELDSSGSSTRCPSLIEVELRLVHVAEFVGLEGARVVVRGSRIFVDDSTSYTWDSDLVGGTVQGDERKATIRFCQDLSLGGLQEATDFKVFVEGTWNEVVRDNGTEDGNIRLELARLARGGEKIVVQVDARSEGAVANPPTINDEAYEMMFQSFGQNALCPSLLEVELALDNIPEDVAPSGQSIVVRGAQIYRDDNNYIDWGGDDVSAVVQDGHATLTFCQNTLQTPETDFKVFIEGTWDEVLRKEDEEGADIRLNLRSVGFEGGKVRIHVDASDSRVRPPA